MNLSNKQREPVDPGIRVQVDATAMQKLRLWTDMAKGEVSALGLVEEIRDANSGAVTSLLVTDFFMLKQYCTLDETTMEPASIAELMGELEAQGISSGKLRCWAHSHGSLSVFWSTQDDITINNLANGEWLLSLVVNKLRHSQMRLDQYHPCHMYLSDIAWEVYYPLVNGLAESCLSEFKTKVTEAGLELRSYRAKLTVSPQDLKSAHDRGVLSDEELQEEMSWLGYDLEDLEERFA